MRHELLKVLGRLVVETRHISVTTLPFQNGRLLAAESPEEQWEFSNPVPCATNKKHRLEETHVFPGKIYLRDHLPAMEFA